MAPLFLSAQESSIKVGLLIPDSIRMEIIHACQLAIHEAGESQGAELQGRQSIAVEMAVRTTEGPWGAGSKASVDLIYKDSVVALLCALDGRNAHLAEQVTAKTHVACIETSATDPSLTQAYVPWYLRCVPSDDQQAELILKEIERLGAGKIAIICTGEYDTRMTAHSFTKILARSGSSGPLILNISNEESSARNLADQIRGLGIHHLILSLNAPVIEDLAPLLRKEMPDLNIFGTHAFTASCAYGKGKLQIYEGLYLVTSALPLSGEGKTFEASFSDRYRYQPSVAAAYAYDGMQMILAAIQTSGKDRELIRKSLESMDFKNGLTGQISFDELGNRKHAARLVKIENGQALILDR